MPSSSSADPWRDVGYADLADTVRRICTRCGWTQASADFGQTLAVVSATRGEGTSSLARAVAIAMALDHDCGVLLVECDLLQPTLGVDLGVRTEPGLTDILAGTVEFAEGLHRSQIPNLWLLPAGGAHDGPSRLLRSAAMRITLDEARRRFPFVVLDLPAVLSSSDSAVLARLVDGAVLVVRAGSANDSTVEQALQFLTGATLHGVVLNRWRTHVPDMVRRIVER